ncbi:MAG: hypothetical protein OCD03_13245 [Hyphomicrobiales bacterium]
MNILEICAEALNQIGEAYIPNPLIGDSDEDAKQITALLNQIGRDLASEDFKTLERTTTLNLVSGTVLYDLPADFGHFPHSGKTDDFAKYGNKIRFNDDSKTGDFDLKYYSKNFCISSDSTTERSAFETDNDFPIIDEELFLFGLKWQWKAAKGDEFAMELAMYDGAKNKALFRDSNAGVISL